MVPLVRVNDVSGNYYVVAMLTTEGEHTVNGLLQKWQEEEVNEMFREFVTFDGVLTRILTQEWLYQMKKIPYFSIKMNTASQV